MDKKEFQNLFKIYMKEKGFRIKGQCAYQFVDDQYIIGIHLDHHPYTKGYFVEYCAIYDPDAIQRQKVLLGKCPSWLRKAKCMYYFFITGIH